MSKKQQGKKKIIKQAKPKSTVRKQTVKKVWHIFHFEQRFELSDNVRFCRQSPLVFIREYVGSGTDDESISYKHQVEVLKANPNRHTLRSAFDDLKEIAANRSRCYRGYLLDEKFEPANNKRIAQWTGLQTRAVAKVLRELEEVGLIEQVNMPVFDLSKNEFPQEEKNNKPKNPPDGGKKGGRTSQHEPARARTCAHGQFRAPLKKGKGKGKGKGKSESGKGNIKKKNKSEKVNRKEENLNPPTTLTEPEKVKQSESYERENKQQSQRTAESNPRGGKAGVRRTETTTTPPATHPINPTESDLREGQKSLPVSSGSPPGSIVNFEQLRKLYDPAAREFGAVIFKALRVPFDPLSTEGKSELGCFAAAWTEAQQAKLGPLPLQELWNKSIRSAERIGNKRRRARFRKSAEAVWRYEFNQRLKAIITAATRLPAGVSPAKVTAG